MAILDEWTTWEKTGPRLTLGDELRVTPTTMMNAATRRLLLTFRKAPPLQATKHSLTPLTMQIPRDVREFIDDYPGIGDDANASENLGFYSNTLRCRPDNQLIDEIHEQ